MRSAWERTGASWSAAPRCPSLATPPLPSAGADALARTPGTPTTLFVNFDGSVLRKGCGTNDRWSLVGHGIREPLWHGPVGHASISLGAASEDFLKARVEGAEAAL